MTTDPFDLERFVEAQDTGGVYRHAVAELQRGHKATHWMWFVFPQIRGLGVSPISRMFAIESLDEAKAYLAHPVLGARLNECASIVLHSDALSAEEIFGGIDARKLHSSMTLFEQASPEATVFGEVLERFFSGDRDEATLGRL